MSSVITSLVDKHLKRVVIGKGMVYPENSCGNIVCNEYIHCVVSPCS